MREFISVVLPAFNEEKNIEPIFFEIQKYLGGRKFEVVIVDDGSQDGTAATAKSLANTHPEVQLLQLTRNFGHQAALLAGLSISKGDAVIAMDCDMQHPPQYLPEMIDAWQRGIFVIQMRRTSADGISWQKKFLSEIFYKMINRMSRINIHPNVADFMLLDRQVVEQILAIEGRSLFLRGLISWLGYKSVVMDYAAPMRRHGKASYTIGKSMALAMAAILTLSKIPLRIGVFIGLGSALLAILFLFYSVHAWANGDVIAGWTSLVTIILLLGSVQMVVLGIIGEYVGNLFDSARGLDRPPLGGPV